ncbi:MAG TPA: ABC transporter permease [Xanthobacteraceae bacterium]|jgi:cell division transport system permease protein|nr:ABC transporter permease [Xanthobacteraceae bacterium]
MMDDRTDLRTGKRPDKRPDLRPDLRTGARPDLRGDGAVSVPPTTVARTPPRIEAPIVPGESVPGQALIAVVAIMTFLASLTVGFVMMVQTTAAQWESDIAREVTIQVKPQSGRDLQADIARAAALAKGYAGVADVHVIDKAEAMGLLEPWLGTGLSLDNLPIPRLIVLQISADQAFEPAGLQQQLHDAVPPSSLDDHRAFTERMRTMSRTAVFAGMAILALVIAATILSVTFAARGAMAGNRPIIEVLHFTGARDRFIARHFQRHFLVLGLKGAAIGGCGAILIFLAMGLLNPLFRGTAGGDESAALFGALALGFKGYVAVVVQAAAIAALTALTSRHAVYRTLAAIE